MNELNRLSINISGRSGTGNDVIKVKGFDTLPEIWQLPPDLAVAVDDSRSPVKYQFSIGSCLVN